MNSELVYPSNDVLSHIMAVYSLALPPANWRVDNNKINKGFSILLDDDRRIMVGPDPDPRYNKPNHEIKVIELAFHYPISLTRHGMNLDWVHRFADRINWIIPVGKALVDNDRENGPNGVIWLKHSINVSGGVSKNWLSSQLKLFIESMEMINRYHKAERESPLEEGQWI